MFQIHAAGQDFGFEDEDVCLTNLAEQFGPKIWSEDFTEALNFPTRAAAVQIQEEILEMNPDALVVVFEARS